MPHENHGHTHTPESGHHGHAMEPPADQHSTRKESGAPSNHVHQMHGGHGTDSVAGAHDRHAGHSVQMFRDKFWGTLLFSVPTIVWAPMIQHWFGYQAPGGGVTSRWVPAVF